MVAARRLPNLDVFFITRGLSVNIIGNWSFVANIITANIIPRTPEVNTFTKIESFAVFGFPAPSSFDTLTLQKDKKLYTFRGCMYIYTYIFIFCHVAFLIPCSSYPSSVAKLSEEKVTNLTAALKPRAIISVHSCKFILSNQEKGKARRTKVRF